MAERYRFGFLNPIADSGFQKRLSANTAATLHIAGAIVKNMYESQYGADVLSNHGAWRAIVLETVPEEEYLNDTTLEPYLAEFQGISATNKVPWVVRARIPELHALIPDPFDEPFVLQEVVRTSLIKAHPIFVGFGEDYPPQEGDLIVVDFKDRVNRRIGIIVEKPVINDANPGGGAISRALNPALEYKQKCTNKLAVNAPSGDAIGSEKKEPNSMVATSEESVIQRERCVKLANQIKQEAGQAKTSSAAGGNRTVGKKDWFTGPNPYANEVSDYDVLWPIPQPYVFKYGEFNGYHHIPDLEGKRDLRSEELTEGSFLGSLIRMVGGYNPNNKTWSRPINSYVTLDTWSVGFAHYWAETAAKLFVEFASVHASLAKEAFGKGVEIMTDEKTFWAYFSPPTRKIRMPATRNWLRSNNLTGHHHPKWDWFVAGFHHIAFMPQWIELYSKQWVNTYLVAAATAMKTTGGPPWVLEKTAAALARCANSGQGAMKSYVRQVRKLDERLAIKKIYMDSNLYNEPDRLARLDGIFNETAMFDFSLSKYRNLK